MKISKETLTILKNFSQMNSHFAFLPGSALSTISDSENIVATANVDDVFPAEFGIYDLNEFLSVVSLFEEPELEFNKDHVKVKSGKPSIKYYGTDVSMLTLPTYENSNIPRLVSKFPASEIEFELTAEQINIISKTSSVLKSPDIAIVGDGKTVKVIVSDKANPTSNSFDLPVAESKHAFQANLKVDNMKLLPGDYTVFISTKKLSKWVNKNIDIVYFVGLEQDSTFE